MLEGIFNLNEIIMITNMSKSALKTYPEYEFCSRRNSVKFNPSSLDTFAYVRRAYMGGEPLRNAWFEVLYSDGNSLLVIAFFTGMNRSEVIRRTKGEVTAEWVNHRKRLGGTKSVQKPKHSGYKRDRGK